MKIIVSLKNANLFLKRLLFFIMITYLTLFNSDVCAPNFLKSLKRGKIIDINLL